MGKIKEWLKLLNACLNCDDKIGTLYSKRGSIETELFPERIQPTHGVFRREVSDYIIPNDWGRDDPCSVTICRNAEYDWIENRPTNLGAPEDVKTFRCPNLSYNNTCDNLKCQYYEKLKEYHELTTKIAEIENLRKTIVAQRKAAWKNIFSRDSK